MKLVLNISGEKVQEVLMNEVNMTKAIDHPNCLKLVDYCKDQPKKYFWIITDFIDGSPFFSDDFWRIYKKHFTMSSIGMRRGSLFKKLNPNSAFSNLRLKDEHIKSLLKQILNTLNYRKPHLNSVHVTLNMTHKDIKPDNLLVDQQFRVMLIDFGITEKCHHAGAPCLGFKGTKLYSAPEVFQENVSRPRDASVAAACLRETSGQ
jgi:serine/threonine protein kinase